MDYTETFSPLAKMVTVKSVIAIAASKGRCVYKRDMHSAFLQGNLLEEVYMDISLGILGQCSSSNIALKVCRLHKSLCLEIGS